MARFLSQISVLTLVILGFQNCAEAVAPPISNDVDFAVSEEPIGDASSYTKIVFNPALETIGSGNNKILTLDLKTGDRIVELGPNIARCTIPAEKITQLTQILQGPICRTVVPSGYAVCMAYPMADIELSNATSSIRLRPTMCAAEIFLCGGRDSAFRQMLTELRDLPCP